MRLTIRLKKIRLNNIHKNFNKIKFPALKQFKKNLTKKVGPMIAFKNCQ